jgi:hypothetical protein
MRNKRAFPWGTANVSSLALCRPSPLTEILRIGGVSLGQAEISFVYRRPWEKIAVQTNRVTVDVAR